MSLFIPFLLLGLFALFAYLWIRERRFLKKKTSEAMSKQVWSELLDEREEALKRRQKFRETLDKAQKK